MNNLRHNFHQWIKWGISSINEQPEAQFPSMNKVRHNFHQWPNSCKFQSSLTWRQTLCYKCTHESTPDLCDTVHLYSLSRTCCSKSDIFSLRISWSNFLQFLSPPLVLLPETNSPRLSVKHPPWPCLNRTLKHLISVGMSCLVFVCPRPCMDCWHVTICVFSKC